MYFVSHSASCAPRTLASLLAPLLVFAPTSHIFAYAYRTPLRYQQKVPLYTAESAPSLPMFSGGFVVFRMQSHRKRISVYYNVILVVVLNHESVKFVLIVNAIQSVSYDAVVSS